MIFKKGIATISVEKEGNFVKKVFQTLNKYKKERDFYLFTGCLLDFVPKLHMPTMVLPILVALSVPKLPRLVLL